jgi:hypothetical protein
VDFLHRLGLPALLQSIADAIAINSALAQVTAIIAAAQAKIQALITQMMAPHR